MTRRALRPVPDALFDVEPRTGRTRAALERGLRVLRDGGAIEPLDGPRVAVLRTLVESYDRDFRRGASAFQMAAAAREIVDQYNALTGNAPIASTDDVDDLVAALSAPTRDTPPA